jgi:hypothetical protein
MHELIHTLSNHGEDTTFTAKILDDNGYCRLALTIENSSGTYDHIWSRTGPSGADPVQTAIKFLTTIDWTYVLAKMGPVNEFKLDASFNRTESCALKYARKLFSTVFPQYQELLRDQTALAA